MDYPVATIKDVAKLAEVSVATVSCALSGKKNVSHAARVKVMAAIEKLNYVPNESARKLRTKGSRDIGVLLTSIDDLYHSEIFKGITSVIQGNNFSVNIKFSNNQPKVEMETLNEFISRGCVGIILISCMSDDVPYFEKLLSHKIPIVFIERRPPLPDINFVGIDNKKTITYIMERLKERGYKNIALYCGTPSISSESDCAGSFKSFCQKNRRYSDCKIHYTNMSKEDAFRVALTELYHNSEPGTPAEAKGRGSPPDAFIATSENIAQGIIESSKVLGISLERKVIATFSQETWIYTKYLSNAVHTSRPAFKLGSTAATLLLENISVPKQQNNETILMDDNIIRAGIPIPAFRTGRIKSPPRSSRELNILMFNCHISEAAKILARKFRNDCGITINIDDEIQHEVHERIIKDTFSTNPEYDVYMFDIPWLNYFSQNGFLVDLTEFITSDRRFYNSIIKENLDNSLYKKRYYSIPFMGGAQLMFYRTDLFEDPLICKDYYAMNQAKLQPPRTWTEFNTVARFFTRAFNPNSPVEYGTSCHGISAEELCPEIYNRIWGFNGVFFNSDNLPFFNSANNRKAFENLIELQDYAASPVFQTSLIDSVSDFYNGKTAMLVTYTEYAAKIMNAINQNIVGKLGFTFVPRRTPVAIGWNLGINIFSPKKELALKFFKWLYQKDVNYYLTILDGQSASVYPYENNELLKLYPWMPIIMENFRYAQKRITSHRSNSIVIPWNRMENIIYTHTKRMFSHEPVNRCLKDINAEIIELMTVYGHFRGNN